MTALPQEQSQRYYDTSLWDYKPGEFRRFINTIMPKSIFVSEALVNFREFPVIPRKFKEMTVGEISTNPKLIEELLDVRNGMQPETGFRLGCKPKARELQLIDNLAESYPIDKTKAKAKVIVGRYDDRPNQCYTYALEVIIAPRTDLNDYHAGEIEIIDCINDDASSDGNGAYFANGIYEWQEKRRDVFGTDYHKRMSDGLRSLLYDCGFITGSISSKRRKSCVLFINLKCRVIDFLGAKGKTQINTRPFAKAIAEVVSNLACKMPTYHGEGYGRQYSSSDDEENRGEYMEPYLKPFLVERRKAVEANPSLRVKDRLTQSGVWYRIRPIMIEDGFRPRNKSIDKNGRTIYDWATTRRGLTNRIREAIKQSWPNEKQVTREYLGIVAKARAMMYFNGQTFPVSFDSKEELARTGTTDLVIVEKEGITDVLLDVARRYRIALVATGGQSSEYAKDLARLADEAGINVCVLSDYDIDGISIWRHTGANIPRIGIDRDIITWLREHGYHKEDGIEITESDVEEEYSPNPKLFTEDDDQYLQTKRIELDSIVEKAGASALWHYIIDKLEETFPYTRDYSNVISEPEPENYYTEEINNFMEYIKNYTKGSYNCEWTQIKLDAKEVDGLTEVDLEEEANDIILKPIVQDDEGMQTISTKLKELMESGALPKIKEVPKPEEKEKESKPVRDRSIPNKNQKPITITTAEDPKLKKGVKIHVGPEYDIFGVYNPESNIFREEKGQSNKDDTFDTLIEEMLIKKLPNESRSVMREVLKFDTTKLNKIIKKDSTMHEVVKYVETIKAYSKNMDQFINNLPKEKREATKKKMMDELLHGGRPPKIIRCKDCNAVIETIYPDEDGLCPAEPPGGLTCSYCGGKAGQNRHADSG